MQGVVLGSIDRHPHHRSVRPSLRLTADLAVVEELQHRHVFAVLRVDLLHMLRLAIVVRVVVFVVVTPLGMV